ncbi:hypothetical protein [Methyloceanibacter sp.]|uniref:hypothetical protein n=1 Tax=Methyloceanibacter sp. TaxID=1965321 RepID=UPI003D6C8C16
MTIMRYAILVTLAIASLCAMVSAGADNGQRFLVDAGQSSASPQDFFLWVLAGIAVLTTVSLCRFVVFGIPTLLGDWYTSNKQWLGTLLLLALMSGAFYLTKGKVSETGEPRQGPSIADPASYGGYAASDQKVE